MLRFARANATTCTRTASGVKSVPRIRLGLPQPVVPIFWGLFFIEATFGAYLSIWPLWIEHLGASVTVVGIVLGSSGFIRLFVIGPSAAIADRIGFRRAIMICRSFSVVGLLAAAVATHWTFLIIMLLFGAIGELVFPLTWSLVAAQAAEQKMRAFALIFTVGPSISMTISPLISGGLVQLFGMRAAFFFGAACSFAALYFLAKIQEPPSHARDMVRVPSSYRDAIGDPGVRLAVGLLFVTVFSLSLGTAFIPTFLEDVRGVQPSVISIISAAAAIGTLTFGLAVARIRKLQRAPFVAVMIAVAMIGIGFGLFRSTSFYPLLAIAFYCRGGLFSAWAMISAALGDIAPAAHRARAFAISEMVGGIAFALGPIVAGPLYAHDSTLSFDVAIVLCLILMPVLYFAQRKAKQHRRDAERAALIEATELEAQAA